MGTHDTSLEHHHDRLVEVIRAAHADGVEVAGWLAGALGDVARELPGGAASLVARRPGSWEADLVRRLVNGTIGWPEALVVTAAGRFGKPEAPAGGYLCHRCGRPFPTVSKLRVHAVVDEHRAATPEERRGSGQMPLPIGSRGEGRR